MKEVSPLTSGRLSHSSGPLNGGGSFTETDSPPISPSDDLDDVVKVLLLCFFFSIVISKSNPCFSNMQQVSTFRVNFVIKVKRIKTNV